VRVLIVDDEPPARAVLRNMLRRHPGVEIAGECAGGAEAIESIASLTPDLVFLDVQMPEVDGFAVLQAIAGAPAPYIVLVTAYDRYAVRAFEVEALDYLLKPFDTDRFDHVLDRARRRRSECDWESRLASLASRFPARTVDRFLVHERERVLLLCAVDVDWIEAQGNYVSLHGNGHAHLFRESLASLETRLDPRVFRRIHRSAIVNLDAIRELRQRFHGEYEVLLRHGQVLKLGRRFRANLEMGAIGRL
jgi:two-component system LytT family response regulator